MVGEHLLMNIIPNNFSVETGWKVWCDRDMSETKSNMTKVVCRAGSAHNKARYITSGATHSSVLHDGNSAEVPRRISSCQTYCL